MVDPKLRDEIIKERIMGKQTVTELSSRYGVSPGTVSRWASQYIKEHGSNTLTELAMDKDAEIERLRTENRRLIRFNSTLMDVLAVLTGGSAAGENGTYATDILTSISHKQTETSE